MRTLWASLSLFCACGARTDLGEAVDAAAAPPDASAVCTAVEYTSNDASPSTSSLSVVGGYVYYVSSSYSGVVRVPVAGGAPTVLASDSSGWASAFVVDDTYVWWVVGSNGSNYPSLGKVGRVPIAGGTAETLGCATSDGCPAVFGTEPVVVAQTADALVVGDAIKATLFVVPKAGGSAAPLVPPATAPTLGFDQLTVEGTDFLWIASHYLYDATIGAYSEQTILSQWATGVTSFGGNAYWTLSEQGASSLVRRDATGALTTLFTGPLTGPLRANEAFVYGFSAGGISRVPATGGATMPVLKNIQPTTYVVDDACIYFIDGGAVRRLPG